MLRPAHSRGELRWIRVGLSGGALQRRVLDEILDLTAEVLLFIFDTNLDINTNLDDTRLLSSSPRNFFLPPYNPRRIL